MADGAVADPPETMDDFQPEANSSVADDSGGKKVTVSSDEPDVFNFTPDSLEVKQLEKPAKRKAQPRQDGLMPKDEQDRIMRELKADVEQARERVTDQKLKLQRTAFILDKMQSAMAEYQSLIDDKFAKFLANNDALQAEWLGDMSRRLPSFGDYMLVLSAESEEAIGQAGLAGPVAEKVLQQLVDDVVTNLYGAGSLLKHHLTLCRDINNRLRDKTDCLQEHGRAFPRWKAMMDEEDAKIRERVQEIFSVTSWIAFLGLRDPPAIPPLDVSLNKSRANVSLSLSMDQSRA